MQQVYQNIYWFWMSSFITKSFLRYVYFIQFQSVLYSTRFTLFRRLDKIIHEIFAKKKIIHHQNITIFYLLFFET